MTMAFLLFVAAAIFFNSPSFGQQNSRVGVVVSNGIQFEIPPGYIQHKGKDRSTLIVEPPEGSHTFALIKVYFELRPTDIPGHDRTQEKMAQLGLSKTAELKAILAGREGKCVEYSVKTKSGAALAQAECSFGTELHASFLENHKISVSFTHSCRRQSPHGRTGSCDVQNFALFRISQMSADIAKKHTVVM